MLSAYTVTMCFDTPSITLCIYIFVLKPEFFYFSDNTLHMIKKETADVLLHLLPFLTLRPVSVVFLCFFFSPLHLTL